MSRLLYSQGRGSAVAASAQNLPSNKWEAGTVARGLVNSFSDFGVEQWPLKVLCITTFTIAQWMTLSAPVAKYWLYLYISIHLCLSLEKWQIPVFWKILNSKEKMKSLNSFLPVEVVPDAGWGVFFISRWIKLIYGFIYRKIEFCSMHANIKE